MGQHRVVYQEIPFASTPLRSLLIETGDEVDAYLVAIKTLQERGFVVNTNPDGTLERVEGLTPTQKAQLHHLLTGIHQGGTPQTMVIRAVYPHIIPAFAKGKILEG